MELIEIAGYIISDTSDISNIKTTTLDKFDKTKILYLPEGNIRTTNFEHFHKSIVWQDCKSLLSVSMFCRFDNEREIPYLTGYGYGKPLEYVSHLSVGYPCIIKYNTDDAPKLRYVILSNIIYTEGLLSIDSLRKECEANIEYGKKFKCFKECLSVINAGNISLINSLIKMYNKRDLEWQKILDGTHPYLKSYKNKTK